MMIDPVIVETAAASAFSKQAPLFDHLYGSNTIINYKRQRVWNHVHQFLKPSSFILELNAGTGEDASWLAQQGHLIHATDISEGMEKVFREKIKARGYDQSVSFERCSFNQLETLKQRGPYDHVFSNFAGLNCSPRLDKILHDIYSILKPGGHATVVLLPRFCLWEFLLLFKGRFKTAFRRFSGRNGSKAKIEGEQFRCWYYNPSYVYRHSKNLFDVVSVEGLCTIVPPSYLEHFAEKHPQLYNFLAKKEDLLSSKWPWRSIGDYFIITLKKKI